jgi:hypothetical protein
MLRLMDSEAVGEKPTRRRAPQPLNKEIKTLRAALEITRRSMESCQDEQAELARMGGLLARLCDSLTRALLAQQKLASGKDDASGAKAELERLLRLIEPVI